MYPRRDHCMQGMWGFDVSTEAVTPEVAQAVREAIREKGPISGIHALQALTGFGLRDAKDWVDNCGEYYRKPTGVFVLTAVSTRGVRKQNSAATVFAIGTTNRESVF
jgi:hypothetical protein